ncbi:hypothetical protein PsorP6_006656 [Peronosclerospora sorghi]|uniref:Uncharacterized protein n=1 Tax=Peronosclerospora sorghi TaxID=230839 RepID=A0ACC0W6B0_9STRA|nr:hypothetical protein PsorP6_006656 [Peronosclerospora sorghi]
MEKQATPLDASDAPVVTLKKQAQELLEDKVKRFEAQKRSNMSSDDKYLVTMINSGTLSDRVAALTLTAQAAPLHSLHRLGQLMAMATKKARLLLYILFAMSYPSIYEIADILFNEDKCIGFLIEKGAFNMKWTCEECNRQMEYYPKRYRFRCTTKKCSKQFSLRMNTFFQGRRLPIHKIFHLGYLWLKGDKSKSIQGTTKHSKHTIAVFSKYFRQLITESLDENTEIIGGPV